jgi:hypothetical protein
LYSVRSAVSSAKIARHLQAASKMASDAQKPGPKIENPPEVLAQSEPKQISLPFKADDLEEIKKAVEDGRLAFKGKLAPIKAQNCNLGHF